MADKPAAKNSRRWWGRLESLSEIALLVGCFLVVAGLVFEDWVATFRISGEVAVIVGVMIEGLADGGIFLAAGKVRLIQDAELEQMRLETAQANARAAEANLELARIERRFAPRELSAEEKKRIAAKLGECAPHAVTIIEARYDDPEAKDFVVALLLTFNDAGWTPNVTADPQHFSRSMRGLLVMVNEDEASGETQRTRAADCLVNALLTEGIFARGPLCTPRLFKGLPDVSIMVVVGAKPDFPKEIN